MKKRSVRRSPLPQVESLEARELLSSSPIWSGYARDPQHSALSSVAGQSFDAIRWSTPVDTQPPGSLSIHYGSPMVTAANTILVPVKTSSTGNFEVTAHSGLDGSLLWTQTTSYTVPSSQWFPSFSPTLTPATVLDYPEIGGLVDYCTDPDTVGATRTGQLAFYGMANYQADPTDYNNHVQICTPLTADSAGNIYFGFLVTGYTPLGLVSGIARIDTNGNGTYVSASAAAGDNNIASVQYNSAPALSTDGTHLYVAVNTGDFGRGYLLELNSTTLATQAKVVPMDPHTNNDAALPDISTASPTVGPDGDVYFGVFEHTCCTNNDRGWLMHYSGDLSQTKTPGAFGWDDTVSIVPASMVTHYTGSSSYLLMTKYNNYADIGTGDGHNKIAILDPNATEVDPVTGATVMQEVMTILGQTPDPDNSDDPGAVREWCINNAAVDPATHSIMANSEDGRLYRWDTTTPLGSPAFSQSITLTTATSEAYTPTVIGADGTIYAINDATLWAVGQTGLISGTVYNDLNGDGTRETGEPGLFGWTVQLLDSNGNLLTSTTTDSNGNYAFPELAAGTYEIREVAQSGWTQTSANQNVTLSATQQVTGVNIGNFQQITLTGTVFSDTNDNRVLDPGEPGIAAVTLTLSGAASGTTVTDGSGHYSFGPLGPGTYTVTETVPNQYIETSPAGNTFSFTPTSGANATENWANDVPKQTLDNGQTGYMEIGGGFYTVKQGWNGTSRTRNNTSLPVYAQWVMHGLTTEAKVELFVTWVAAPDRSPAALYKIFNNSQLIGKVTVDQTHSPADAFYQGVYWKSLGYFSLTGTHPTTIQLWANNTGSVNADGVMALHAGTSQMLDLPAVAAGRDVTPLTQAQLQPVVAEAQALWLASGLTSDQQAALSVADVEIATPAAGQIATTIGHQVWIDPTAGGHGWFLDLNPSDAPVFAPVAGREFQAVPGSAAAREVDLLTVVAHELGHILGLPDVSNLLSPHDLMDTYLGLGTRRLPPAAPDVTGGAQELLGTSVGAPVGSGAPSEALAGTKGTLQTLSPLVGVLAAQGSSSANSTVGAVLPVPSGSRSEGLPAVAVPVGFSRKTELGGVDAAFASARSKPTDLDELVATLARGLLG
jgi:hypothetical protein